MQDLKVYSAAIFGFSLPGANLLMQNIGPVLNTLVLLGQVGVAAVTILYIYTKWKKLRSSKNDNDDEPV